MTVQPYFRDAVRGDVSAIATILGAESVHDDSRPPVTVESCRRLLDDVERHDGCYVLVGEYDSQIGAVLEMSVFPTFGGRTAEIVGLWTAEQFRTTGIDGLLLDHAIERAYDLRCSRIQVMAAGPRRREHSFWERSGFIHLDAGYVRTSQRRLRRIS